MQVQVRARRAVQILGLATAAYSGAAIARPALLARPCGLADPDGSVPESTARVISAVGVRDAVISLGMIAGRGRTRQAACVARALSDFGDAAVFGARLEDPRARAKVVGVAVGWGTVCLVAGVLAGRR